MKSCLLVFFTLVLLLGCYSGTDSNPEQYWKSSQFGNLLITLDEKPTLGKKETRIWIEYSMMAVAELYKVDQRRLYYKIWNEQANFPSSDTLTSDQKVIKKLQATIDRINEIDSPSKCDYCDKLGDGALVVYESWHAGDFIVKERNLGELNYPDMIIDSGLGNVDELKLLFSLIEMLELKE